MLGASSARHSFHGACVCVPGVGRARMGGGLSPLKAHSVSLSQNGNFQNPVSSSLQLETARARLGPCPGLGSTMSGWEGNQI